MPGRRADRPPPILKLAPSTASSPSSSSSASAPAALPFAACGSSIHSTRVHFPPTPKLACKGLTYPPHAYDRAPIVVSENTCALPRRGDRAYHAPPPGLDERTSCRPRTRTPVLPATGYFALGAASGAGDALSPGSSSASSSESDDSDTSVATPPTPDYAHDYYGRRRASAPVHAALAFLPHPPAPPASTSPERKRRSATPCRARRSPVRCPSSTGGFGDDSGCLGGF